MLATELKVQDRVAIQYPCCPGGGLKQSTVIKVDTGWGAWVKVDGTGDIEVLTTPAIPNKLGVGWWKL